MTESHMLSPNEALPGRTEKMTVTNSHYVTGNPLLPPFPIKCKTILFGLGCFWGAEHEFWSLSGVYSTAVGYTAGLTPNPTYQEVCSGLTGHNETVLIAYQPHLLEFETLLKIFWDAHDPTQGMRQGNDIGTQYRSGIYTHDREQNDLALASKHHHQQTLTNAGFGTITTEIMTALEFYYAEDYHQQYLAKNPSGYCGLGGLGVEYTMMAQ